MSRLAQRLKLWLNDPLLQRLLRNSGYLFSGSAITLVLNMGQSILASRMLGMAGFGLLGTITVFSSTVNRLFSFRMGEVVVKYLGADLAENRKDRAGALVKAAALSEAATSLLAFAAVLLLAGPASIWLGKDPATRPWFILYSFSILGNLVYETSTGVLQMGGHFRSQAVINVGQSALTALIILVAFFLNGDMWVILSAYLVGKIILGTAPAILAFQRLNQMLGPGWWRAPFSLLPPLRPLFGFAANTNLSATITLLVRDSEVLWISLLMGNTEAGFYKVALAIINLVTVPVTPLISTTYPEISKVAALRELAAHALDVAPDDDPLRRLFPADRPGVGDCRIVVGVVVWGGCRPGLPGFADPAAGLRRGQHPLLESPSAAFHRPCHHPDRGFSRHRFCQSVAGLLCHPALWLYRRGLAAFRVLPDLQSDSGLVSCVPSAKQRKLHSAGRQLMKIACLAPSQVPSTTANSIQVMKVCQSLAQIGHTCVVATGRASSPVG